MLNVIIIDHNDQICVVNELYSFNVFYTIAKPVFIKNEHFRSLFIGF